MKLYLATSLATCILILAACEKKESADYEASASISDELVKSDTPILPVEKGDMWKYKVSLFVPAGATSKNSAASELETEKTRTYVGKVHAADNRPETDAFDVVVQGEPVERELVEIYDDRVMIRGTMRPESPEIKSVWLEPAIPCVAAGMRSGHETRPFSILEGTRKRGMKVVAREKVTVPAGEYSAIRMLMTGTDAEFQVRRTTWFAPQVGIVKEEETRYMDKKLLSREITELVETSVGKK